MPKNILLVDDHEIVRIGLRHLLDGSDMIISHEATNSRAAISFLSEIRFDLVVVDPRLAEGDGFVMIKEMKRIRPDQNMLLFSELDSHPLTYHAISLGMTGFVSKLADSRTILGCFRRAANGEALWSNDEVKKSYKVELSNTILETKMGVPLTKRESDVLEKLASGMTNREIATAFGISYETVKEHVQHILRKIGVSDRTQAAVWAVRNKLV
ncbi:MAG: LuxR C-terminal-related transcriptional regulator [Pirellula sp.]|jgi:DNA-binding NarL/FixJ family response regulator